jgi:copper chaperone CopZ
MDQNLSEMTHTYHISGMTCSGCVAKVKSELLKLGDVTAAEVQLASPQAIITMQSTFRYRYFNSQLPEPATT